MTTEHIGVVTGLSDLANFLAALRRRSRDSGTDDLVRVALFGGKRSRPAGLDREFTQVASDAFPEVDLMLVPPGRVSAHDFNATGSSEPLLVRKGDRRVVYGNGIHKPSYQAFYAFLAPDEFVFYDNGLSSYWTHNADLKGDFASRGIPFPTEAFLSLAPSLQIPPYLSSIPYSAFTYDDFAEIYAQLRKASRVTPCGGWLAGYVVLGTSLFRTKQITWEAERDIYRRLIDRLGRRAAVTFKAHPRATDRPLLTPDDGVDVVDTGVPVEAFARPGERGVAYSISSTSLFTLRQYLGWTCYRLESPACRAAIDKNPHLGMVNVLAPAQLEER